MLVPLAPSSHLTSCPLYPCRINIDTPLECLPAQPGAFHRTPGTCSVTRRNLSRGYQPCPAETTQCAACSHADHRSARAPQGQAAAPHGLYRIRARAVLTPGPCSPGYFEYGRPHPLHADDGPRKVRSNSPLTRDHLYAEHANQIPEDPNRTGSRHDGAPLCGMMRSMTGAACGPRTAAFQVLLRCCECVMVPVNVPIGKTRSCCPAFQLHGGIRSSGRNLGPRIRMIHPYRPVDPFITSLLPAYQAAPSALPCVMLPA